MSLPVAIRRHSQPGLRAGLALLTAVALAACAPEPQPRSVFDFMEDGLARDGVLTRCNRDRSATLDDVECANARRAAGIVALEADRARETALARESANKLAALRQREDRQSLAEQDASAAALAAAEAAYEARWRNPPGTPVASDSVSTPAPAYGAPVGAVMPSMTESALVDLYREDADTPGRPGLAVVHAEPPSNELRIDVPKLELDDLSGIPRPFRSDAELAQQ